MAKRVLIIEDSPDIQRLLIKLLESSGFLVNCASNGQEALEILKDSVLPDAILLDLMMPEMDGYQFRQEQKQNPRIAKIPLVVMTAEGSAHQRIKDLGAAAFLKKPFAGIDVILDTLEKLF